MIREDGELSMTGSDKVKADALRQLAAERLGAALGHGEHDTVEQP